MAVFQRRGRRVRAIVRKAGFNGSKSFDTLKDARLWARAKEREADLGDVLPPGLADGTLGELIARYQRQIWPLKRWGPSKAHELRRLDADLGSKPLASLSKQAIVAYAQHVAKSMNRAGVATRLSYLRTVITTARDLWGLQVPLAALD